MIDFSVVICTYNGEARLPAVLRGLRSQLHTQHFRWEVVVVDNNSCDRTAAVIQAQQSDWLSHVPLRYVFEPKQGLAWARRCAIANTRSPLVGFLDDDTQPTSNWVSAAYQFGQQHPDIGAYGSEIRGNYEVSPPRNFQRIASCLAIIERGSEPFQYPLGRGVLPAGAGMVVRRLAWLAHVPAVPRLAGVKGQSVAAKGEDVETLSYIRQGGWPIWHNPAMKLHHFIPQERLQRNYLMHLFKAIGCNRYPLRMTRYQPWQKPIMTLLHGFYDAIKLLRHILYTQHWQSSDLVETCERVLLVNSLTSPIHHWKQTWPKPSSKGEIVKLWR